MASETFLGGAWIATEVQRLPAAMQTSAWKRAMLRYHPDKQHGAEQASGAAVASDIAEVHCRTLQANEPCAITLLEDLLTTFKSCVRNLVAFVSPPLFLATLYTVETK
eukprot:5932509-Amphidinium_carterae.2